MRRRRVSVRGRIPPDGALHRSATPPLPSQERVRVEKRRYRYLSVLYYQTVYHLPPLTVSQAHRPVVVRKQVEL